VADVQLGATAKIAFVIGKGNNMSRRLFVVAALAAAAVTAIPVAAQASNPSAQACANRNINQIDKFLDCISGEDAFAHMQAFQDIADANGGTRASATPGYDESADYVVEQLEAVGLEVERQAFQAQIYRENSASLSADGASMETQSVTFSGSGSVVGGTIIPVDLDLGLGNFSSSGCEPGDFTGLDFSGPADVALIQRGACSFFDKAFNAEAAGAEAMVLFNQGDTEDRKGIVNATLGGPGVTIPVVSVAYDNGVALVSAPPASIDVAVDAETFAGPTENIIAELPGRNPDNVVMLGAHLDSVIEGPGVQDNGSGSAAVLAIAQAMAGNKQYVPENTVRFAWWADEEQGLNGSFEYFVNPDFGLLNTPEEVDKIAGYLNFDMIASPNFVYGVYDADESSFPAPPGTPIPAGSEEIEDLFEAYYTIEGVPYDDTEYSGRSDYQVFILLDIPSGGLFTGAEQLKTPAQVEIWGGVAGEQYDPCYHLACDTIDNVSTEALDTNVDAAAYATYILASTTEAVNGVPGVEPKGTTPGDIELDGPQGSFTGGGGLDHDHDHDQSEI
jgi:Zn-dependent M28 family amino/carboxypeptidase